MTRVIAEIDFSFTSLLMATFKAGPVLMMTGKSEKILLISLDLTVRDHERTGGTKNFMKCRVGILCDLSA